MLYKSMRPEQINVSEEQVSQVTKIFDREYENPFGIHADKEKLVNISSGAAQDDDIAGNILNMVNVRKKVEDFGQNRLVSKEISFHGPIKKNNHKLFPHVMPKIQITKKDGSVKDAEVNKNILRFNS